MQRKAELCGHELGKHHLAKIVQQTHDKTVSRVGTFDPLCELPRDSRSSERVHEVLLDIKTGHTFPGQHTNRGNTQRQIFDAVEPHVDDRMVDRGNPLGQTVVGRVDHLEYLDRHHRVFFNHLHQVLGRAIHVARQLQNALHTFRESRHALDCGIELLGEFGRHVLESLLVTRFCQESGIGPYHQNVFVGHLVATIVAACVSFRFFEMPLGRFVGKRFADQTLHAM